MAQEAISYGYTGTMYTREDWMLDFRDPKVKVLPVFKWDQHEKWEKTFHWGSGLHSAHLALRHKTDVLVMIGHDFWSADGLHNNLYKGTNNYQSVDYSAVDPRFWVLQFAILFAQFPDTQFFFCQPNIDNWKKPQEWETYSNVRYQELSTLTDNLISVTG
jgi:hypothetical protein